jgi:hypothetical protein
LSQIIIVKGKNTMKLKQLAAAFALIGLSAAASANLVTNGDFETGDLTGWSLTGNTGFTGVSPGGPTGFYFHSGPVGSPGFLDQTLSTTAGTTYNIDVDMQLDGGGFVDIFFDGSQVFSLNSNGNTWTHYSFTGFASTGSTVLSIESQNDPSWNNIDNVSVTGTVPEPASIALLGAGLLGLAAARKRKQA